MVISKHLAGHSLQDSSCLAEILVDHIDAPGPEINIRYGHDFGLFHQLPAKKESNEDSSNQISFRLTLKRGSEQE